MRVLVVSHSMTVPGSWWRWRLLAKIPDVQVRLLVPAIWHSRHFGKLVATRTESFAEERFEVVPIPVTNREQWWRYLLKTGGGPIRSFAPDIIHVDQEENTWALQQMILYRRLFAPRARLGFFSYNNIEIPRRTAVQRFKWWNCRRATDYAFAGNQDTRQVLLANDYRQPLHVQTQIGVHVPIFDRAKAQRNEVRRRLELTDTVIGYAGRLVPEKGLHDLFAAVAMLPEKWALLVVGDGPLRRELECRARAWNRRTVFVGHVPQAEIPEWMAAMDCFVLPSRTIPGWREQFGLVLAEAMISGLPVVGTASGAIPEVVGDAGVIVPEGAPERLALALRTLMTHDEYRRELGERGRQRATCMFGTAALARSTRTFFATVLTPSPGAGVEATRSP